MRTRETLVRHTQAVYIYIQQVLTGSLSPGDQGLAQVTDVEHGWCLDIIPILLGKGVDTAKHP